MNLGARGAITSGGIPYVTNGLTHIWDGKWNAGIGLNDPALGKIVNLVDPDNHPFVINSNGSITEEGFSFNGLSATCDTNEFDWKTCQVVFNLKSGRIVFYGSRYCDTSLANRSDFFCIAANDKELLELCIRNDDVEDFACVVQSRRGKTYSLTKFFSTDGSGAAYTGTTISTVKRANTWGAQKVTNIGGRVASTNYDGAGMFYCLRLYDRELTEAEIAANYAIDKARFGLT